MIRLLALCMFLVVTIPAFSQADSPPPIVGVIKDYRDNPISAKRKYEGKTIGATGEIFSIREDRPGTAVLSFMGSYGTTNIYGGYKLETYAISAITSEDVAANMSICQKINVQCTGVSKSNSPAADLILSSCRVRSLPPDKFSACINPHEIK